MGTLNGMAATTTIKVPPGLRDRVNRDARARGLTAAQLLTELVDSYERKQRMDDFGRAFAAAGYEYRDETAAWDVAETAWPDA